MEPRVTILLPTHNRADVLGYAIQSVLWQTERSFELLIVGDGCTDDTSRVVASFVDPRIRWFDLPKAPLSGYANRNLALRQARGHYVAYAQHDDILFPDHVEKLVTTLDTNGVDWAYSRPIWIMPDGVVVPFAVNLTHGDELDHFLRAENYVPSTCVIHTRSALERVGYWPENVQFAADWGCWQQIIRTSESGTAGYCASPTALHFRSIWRQEDYFAEGRLRTIAESDWWPTVCKISVPTGVAEQKIFFEKLCSDFYIEQVRSAAIEISDRLAWAWTVPSARTWPSENLPFRDLTRQLGMKILRKFTLAR